MAVVRRFGWSTWQDELLMRSGRGPRVPPAEVVDASLHVDTDAVCPDCLQWIHPGDYVRRNAYDLLEHEVCPPVVVRQLRS